MQKLWFCSAGMEAWPDSGTVSDPPGSTLQGHLQDQGNENAITQQVIIEEGASQAHSLREADSGGGQQLKNEAGNISWQYISHKLGFAWYSARLVHASD